MSQPEKLDCAPYEPTAEEAAAKAQTLAARTAILARIAEHAPTADDQQLLALAHAYKATVGLYDDIL